MKIRSGFVANSSSMSYIISFEPFEPYWCVECGGYVVDPLAWFERMEIDSRGDSTHVIFGNVDRMKEDYRNDIEFSMSEIECLKRYHPDVKIHHSTAAEWIKYHTDVIEELQQKINKLTTWQSSHPTHKIIKVQIDYNDILSDGYIKGSEGKRLTILEHSE